MNIIVRCVKCKRDLKLIVLSSPNLQDQIYEISPCDNIDCYDCSKCETDKEISNLRGEIANSLTLFAESITCPKKLEEPVNGTTGADCKNLECLRYGQCYITNCEKFKPQ